MARVRLNLAAGILNGIWGAALALAAVPFYLRYLGMEAYGLVGFYVALQGVLSALDLGLSPTISREVARSRARDDLGGVRNLLYSFAGISWTLAVLIGVAVAVASGTIAESWLRAEKLPRDLVQHAVALIGVAIAARWPLAIYSGALIGAERLVLVSVVSAAAVTLSVVGAVLVLAFVSDSIVAFLLWQAIVGVVHVLVIRMMAWRVLRGDGPLRFDRQALKDVWKFSAGSAVTGLLGVIFLNSDRVVLSRLGSLETLGEYTLAWMVVRCLSLVVAPTFNVIFPRMSFIYSMGDLGQLASIYHSGTRILMAVIWSGAIYLAMFSGEIVSIWTGDPGLAQRISPVISLLAVGTAINTAMYFPYTLQLAAGAIKLPVIITVTLIIIFAPMLFVLISMYGMLGAAGAWLLLNMLYMPFGTWLTHRLLLRGHGLRWMVFDVLLPGVGVSAIVGLGATLAGRLGATDLLRALIGLAFPSAALLLMLVWARPTLARLLRQSPDSAAA